MTALLSPETKPAKIIAPSLLAVILGSVILAVLRATYSNDPQSLAGMDTSGLLVLLGIFGAFSGFFVVMLYSVLVWVYGKAWQSVNAGFVRTLAVMALAFGTVFILQLVVSGIELAATGTVSTVPLTDLSRYSSLNFVGLDLSTLIVVAIVFVGAKRYLGYGRASAGILAVLMLLMYVVGGAMT